jgi:CheY-like chemotaxis protein/HPt (histidine-containing phosphotransfer) domain-containing protein
VPKPVISSNLLETVEAVVIGARRRAPLMASMPLRPVVARRVLIADDNAVNRKVARGILEKAGHEVVAVEHGGAALEVLARERFDLALLDVEMPVLDGLEATRAIRAAELGGDARLPIVALTAQAMSGDRERCLAAGADAYLAKPFEPRELLRLVEALAPSPTGVATRRASIAVAPVGPAIWNRAELLDRVSGDRALLLELVELFLEQGPKLRTQLVDGAAAGDAAAVARVAHQLKGMLATLAAHPASAAARELEETLRNGDAGDLVGRAAVVADAVLRVEEAAAAERHRTG